MAKSSLEKSVAKLRRSQGEFSMAQANSEISMADLDYVQNGLARFHASTKISSPAQEKMTNLK